MVWADLADRVLKTTIGTFKTRLPATYTPSVGSPVEIEGVYDAPDHSSDPQSTAAFDTVAPRLGIRLADLALPPDAGDTLVVNGLTYRVIGVEEDGQGGAELVLNRLG